MINPALHAYPEEAKLIGDMVLGYGEIDLSFALMVGQAIDQKFAVLNAMNQVRSETARLRIANALGAEKFEEYGVFDDYKEAYGAIQFCLDIRNCYAHCAWCDLGDRGLGFARVNHKTFAEPHKPIEWQSITLDFLRRQEAYFEYVRMCILALTHNAVAARYDRPHNRPMPARMPAPNTHNL